MANVKKINGYNIKDANARERIEALETANSYSVSEPIIIGTWTNGKPIYKKMYIGSFNGEKTSLELSGPSNIDEFLGIDHNIVKVQSTLQTGVTADIWEILPSKSEGDYYQIGFFYNSTSNKLILNSTNNTTNPYDYMFAVLYTKTTDSPSL